MKINLLILLLLTYFLKELVWLTIIPIWHFPDEEQHFAQAAFIAEKGYSPKLAEFDVNKEIDKSSEILGTKRDGMGINKFTYHPEYRIPYSNSSVGIYEQQIKNLSTKEDRETMVKREAARYGPIYYYLTSIPYKLFYSSDLFTRVFTSRIVSVIFSTLTVLLAYLIAKQILKKEFASLTVAFLVGFQPMFSFVSAGINSDNLFNLIFSLLIYFSLKTFFNKKINFKYLLFLIVTVIIGFYTKKQIIISAPIILIAYILGIFFKEKKLRKYYLFIPVLLITALILLTKGKINIPGYNPEVQSKLSESFVQYIYWHFRHTVAETIPWYWGVFNWLGVALPRWVYKIQARLLIISALGLLVYLIRQIKAGSFLKQENLKFIFLFLAAGIYYLSIITWDYFFRQSQGFSFGIQGRYFFPTIISHMTIIVIGIKALVPNRFTNLVCKILIIWWTVYSIVGMLTAFGSYYDLSSLNLFINQASQYKPIYLKSFSLVFILSSFIVSMIIWLFKIMKVNERTNT